ncbi:hypothetical protein Tco_0701184 [Tanacetum coccineum]
MRSNKSTAKGRLVDALVAPENRLKIGKCNQQFWATVTKHHFSLRFKMNGKIHTVNVDNFRDMLKIFPKLPDQKFEDPLFKEEILSFIRDLGHTGEIKVLSDVNVNHLHQPWRSFAAIINKCLSGKTTALESLRLSRAQILWGMYHNKNVDYVYLLWEDLVYQVENKNSKKNNDMYYPRFTKVIVDYFMAKDQAIPRRNKMFWHYARDDLMFTTIRVISKHQDTQVYDAILPQHLTNQAMLESEAYKTYRAYATGEKTPKPKSTKKKADSESSPKTKPTQASKGKRIKTSAKGVIPAKKKQSATKSKGLTVLSEVALTEAEQMKIALERSKTQQHSSHASGSGADEGTGVTPGVPDVPSYDSEAEQISWKSSDEEDDDEVNMGNDNDDDADNQDDDGQEYDEQDDDNQDDDDQEHDGQDDEEQDDVNEQTDSDNDGDDFVHPKLSTHDEEDKEEEDSDPRVHTPSNYESTDDEESDEEIQGANVEGEEMDEEETNEEDEANELYRDVNVNLEGRDTEMTDAPRTIVQTTQVIEDTHVSITLVNPEAQQQSSSVSSGFVFNMLNPSLDTAVSSIPSIVDAYLANKMHEAVKIAIQLQSDSHRDEAQAGNADFTNKLDDNIKKIIKDQVKEQVKAQVSKILPKIEKTVNEQLEAEVLTRSSNESKTSHAVAANLSELELKKILIDKMESNKRRDEEDKDEEPSAGSNWGSKRRRAGKELESTSAPKEKTSKTTGKSTEGSKSHHKSHQVDEPMQTAKDLEELVHQEFETGVTEDQPDEETSRLPDWFQKPTKPPTLDHDWNNTLPDADGPITGISNGLKIWSLTQCGVKCREFAQDVYSKCRINTVTKLQIVEWHNYKHLDWITVRKDDDKLYTSKEGDFNRLRIQDIKVMLLLLVQGKLTNLTVEERLAFNTIWRQSDRDKAGAMIQAIDKQLKTRRIMRSLEKFVGGRPYEETLDCCKDQKHAEFDESNANVLERFYTLVGNPVKEILPKLNLPDHRVFKDGGEVFRYSDTVRLSRSDEVLKLKNLKKDAILKLFKITYRESQDKGTSSSLKSMITTSNHKLMIEVKRTQD